MVVSDYKVNKQTLAFVQRWNEFGEAYTVVDEETRTVTVKQPAIKVLEASLNFNGQTLRGAKEGTRELIGSGYFPPYTINEVQGLYVYCTGTVGNSETAYIMLGAVVEYVPHPDGGINVTLINGKELHLKMISCKTFKNREDAARQLKFIREQRTGMLLRNFQYCAEYDEQYGSKLEEKKTE